MKGQVHLMEYVLMSLFVLLVIVLVTFFLMYWQISTTGSEQRRVLFDRAEFLLRAFTNSPYINRNTYPEGSMFEDSKLESITCDNLEKLYGTGWFAEIESMNYNQECDDENPYPYCGKWTYCKREGDAMIFELPVNIYKKTSGEVDIGHLRVGLYYT
jgi:hypothetical protein